MAKNSILGTDKRLRLGLWGLGRGLTFYKTCAHLNIDVVAGCDYNEHMREKFTKANPDAFVTGDDEEFLNHDFDAVLLATYCTEHAADAIRCLKAGKHVLSEVTAFHTMAEGVELVEAVEKSGLVYNMAENYPFSAPQMYVAQKWREGLFGELQYAEGEYVHEIRSLAYTYIDGVPVEPGWGLHFWRSWINFHYYCTHSLGPIMHITQERPTRVVALPDPVRLPGYPPVDNGGTVAATPELINMSNGSVVKNFMGGTTNDSHIFRYYGTKGSAEINHGLWLRLGGAGNSPKYRINPNWGELTDLAKQTGHGGGDFFTLYYFARHILLGEPAFFDIYASADCTIAGILAYRSAQNGGQPYDIPDFRVKKERKAWRKDAEACPRLDVKKGLWPKSAKRESIKGFNGVIKDLVRHATTYRNWADWNRVADDMEAPGNVVPLADAVLQNLHDMRATIRDARELAALHPKSDASTVLNEMLEVIEHDKVLAPNFAAQVKRQRDRIQKKVSKQGK